MTVDRAIAVAGVLIGAIVSYYFYSVSIQKREPTAIISPERTSIVNSNGPELTDLTVLFKGKQIDHEDITAIRIYFWNAGQLAIHKADVIERDHSVRIKFPDNTKILKLVTLKTSREIINVKADMCEDNQHDICLTFDILEHNDGAALQIIYAGPFNTEPKIMGSVEGAGSVKTLKSFRSVDEMNFIEFITYFPIWYLLILLFCFLSMVAIITLLSLRQARTPIMRKVSTGINFLRWVDIIVIALNVVVLGMVLLVGPRYLALNGVPGEISTSTSVR